MPAAHPWTPSAAPDTAAPAARFPRFVLATLAALAAAGRGLLAAAPYVPLLPASISLLAASPEERLRAVRRIREREGAGDSRPQAIASVARGLRLPAATVGSWLAIAARDGRRAGLVVRREVRRGAGPA